MQSALGPSRDWREDKVEKKKFAWAGKLQINIRMRPNETLKNPNRATNCQSSQCLSAFPEKYIAFFCVCVFCVCVSVCSHVWICNTVECLFSPAESFQYICIHVSPEWIKRCDFNQLNYWWTSLLKKPNKKQTESENLQSHTLPLTPIL